jgi:hypothetical protein
MAKIKKAAKKKIITKNDIIEIKVVNDGIINKKAAIVGATSLTVGKLAATKIYPPIYTYIYEREPEDMARIYEEHKSVPDTPKKAKKITGFKLVGGKLVAVSK